MFDDVGVLDNFLIVFLFDAYVYVFFIVINMQRGQFRFVKHFNFLTDSTNLDGLF